MVDKNINFPIESDNYENAKKVKTDLKCNSWRELFVKLINRYKIENETSEFP